MADIKIVITTQAGVETDVSFINEIPLSLNFLIADVRNPDKRNATFSKTINLPGTKEINILFSNIFKLNNSLTLFDPRLKCGIKYYINSRLQLNGDLKLINVTLDADSQEKIYAIAITGTLGNLFVAIGDKLITGNASVSDNVDMSAYDHILSRANVIASWSQGNSLGLYTTQWGLGVYYGLINRGLNNINAETEYHVKHFRPSIFKRELMRQIFVDAGYSWTSTYLDSNEYKRALIDSIGETFTIDATTRANGEFFASRNSNQTGTAYTTTFLAGLWTVNAPTTDIVLFNEDTTPPYNDAGNVYIVGNGEFTVPVTRKYKLITELNGVDYTVTNSLYTVTSVVVLTGDVLVNIMGYNAATSTWVVVASNLQSLANQLGMVISCYHSGIFTAGVKYRVEVQPVNLVIIPKYGAMIPITGGVTTVTQTFGGVVYNPSFPSTLYTSKYFAVIDDLSITEGDLLEVNQALPTNLKKKDWLMAEIQLANLYLEVDPNNPLNYIIEPRSNGFYNGTQDWTNFLDHSKKIEISPVAELDTKRYEYTYKTDADTYNEAYYKEYAQVYGYGYTECTSDFVNGVKKTESIYASTPIVSCAGTGLIIPKIYKNDAGTLKNFKSIIRNLYAGGVINVSWGTWSLKSNFAPFNTIYNTYPFLGDCDNPYQPTLTLCWDTPHRVFYNYQQATFTTNNLMNKFYSQQISELSDKRSSVVKAWFNLDEVTIKNFTFRNKIYIAHPLNAYFYVNSIPNYNLVNQESTQVELLKVQDYPAWGGGTSPQPPDPFNTNDGRIMNNNLSNGDSLLLGSNSVSFGGSGNYVAVNAERVALINCTNVIVNSDVTNFTGVGLVGPMVINSSYSNSTLNGSDSAPNITLTVDTTIDATYNNRIVYVDCTAANVTIIWDSANMVDYKVYFIKIDATANTVIFNNNIGGGTVSGAAMPYTGITAQWNALTLTTTGTNLFIL